MRTLKQVLPEIYNQKRFEIEMAPDSTTEVWSDLTTGLLPDHAWLMHGWEWHIELTDPTVPAQSWPNATSMAWQLQLQRNTESEIMLSCNDDEAIFTDRFVSDVAGVGDAGTLYDLPLSHFPEWKYVITTRTMRLMFRTSTDDAQISSDSYALRGRLYYEVIEMSEQDYVKHGHILKL